MRLFAIILIMVIILSSIAVAKTFTIFHGDDEAKKSGFRKYSIYHGTNKKAEFMKLREKAHYNNMFWHKKDRDEEELEKCIGKITKNWKRTHYQKSYVEEYDHKDDDEPIKVEYFWGKDHSDFGYDEKEDSHLRFKWGGKIKKGEKIC